MSWLQFFTNGNVHHMDDSISNGVTKTKNTTKELKQVLEQSNAGTWQVAPPNKPEPQISGVVGKSSPFEAGINLIKEFEGCELEAYFDPGTGDLPITIGWGSTYKEDGSTWQLGDRITQAEADNLLSYTIYKDFLPKLQQIPTWAAMTENQQGAVLSFAWNVGAYFYGASGFSSITRALSDRQYFGNVPTALMLYTNPGSSVEEGLKRRRKAEGDLWESEETIAHVVSDKKSTLADFGFKKGDYHLVMSDRTEAMRAFASDGKLLWTCPALAKGVNGSDWRYTGADTPPGVYKLGTVYRDIETGNLDPAYGWYTFDMLDLEGQETGIGRAGICLHGGGSGCPDPQAPYQELLPTFGCVRIHNQDLRDRVLPLYDSGRTVFLSVHQ
jgi:GH24 family phage-related lysozyme (muramidase)